MKKELSPIKEEKEETNKTPAVSGKVPLVNTPSIEVTQSERA